MKFTQITEAEYRKFWEKSPQKSFLSAPEIGQLRKDSPIYYLGVKDNKTIKAAAMIRGTKRRWGYDYYAPRGILVDYQNLSLLSFFIPKIKKFLQDKGGYIFRMDPNVQLIERDIDGNKVQGGFNNQEIVKNLQSLGFKKSKYIEGVSQVDWEFVLPVEDKTEESILNDMKSNTRRRLKQATELGIKIKDLSFDELDSFYDILTETAKRKNFETRDLAYFQKMYQLFEPFHGVEFVSAVINPRESINKLSKKLDSAKKSKPKTIKEQKQNNDAIKSLETRINKLKELFPEAEDKEVVLSSGMFMTIQPEILHFLGGNVTAYMKLDGQYVLQWEMIQRALKNKFKRYNFYGIPQNINLHPANYGIYEFKRGFSGHVEQLIGEYELPLSRWYYGNKTLSKVKNKIKRK